MGLNEGFTVSSDGISTESQRRSGGPFETGGDNRYAQVLLVAVPLALFLLMAERRLLLRILAGVCLAAIAVATVYTFSRGGAITLVALTLLAVLLRFIRLRALAVIVLGVAILLIAVPSYWVRISTLSELPGTTSPAESGTQAPDGSIVSRGTENLAAILIFADHPAVGVGPSLYPQYYREYADRLGDYSNQIDIKLKNADRQAHTLYLGILAENGILGFVAIMGAIVVTLLHLNRVRRRCQREKPELALLASGFILSLTAYLITGLFLHLAYARYFFLILALCACASAILARVAAAEDQDPEVTPSHLSYWPRRLRRAPRSRPVAVGQPAGA